MVFYRGSPKVKRRQKKIVDLQMSTLLQRDAKAIDNINRIRFALATALCGEGCWFKDEDGSHTRSLFVVGRGQPGLW
jgi:hypothetical protein